MKLSLSCTQQGAIHPVSNHNANGVSSKHSLRHWEENIPSVITDGGDKASKARQGFIIPFSPDKSYFSDHSTQKKLPIPTLCLGTRQNCTPYPTNDNYFRTWYSVHRPAKRWRERKATHNQRVKITRGYIDRLLKILDDKGVQS